MKRRWGVLVCILVAAWPAVAGATVPPVVGFNLHPQGPSDIARSLYFARDAGANTVRIDAYWSALQPTRRGEYDDDGVAELDAVVDGAAALGMKTLVTLNGTPCWASATPKLCVGDYAWRPPLRPSDYGAVIGWLTARYGAELAGVEMYNEANRNRHYAFTPLEYAQLVIAMRDARTNGVPIVAGALSEADRADLDYMDELWAQPGFASSFDVWATHSYAPPPSRAAAGVVAAVQARREKLAALGSSAPIWVDEFGWSTCSLCFGAPHVATRADQVALLPQTFQALTHPALGVSGAISYDLRDDGTDPFHAEDHYGILENDYTPKPAYDAVSACLGQGRC